jgi:nucleoside-diphosphate-sugar epimerase
MARVLITGMTGSIGQELKKKLQDHGHAVVGEKSHFKRIQQEDYFDQIEQPEDIDVVYHLAAKSFVPDSWNHPAEYTETNVLGTNRVLEFCRTFKAKIVLVSSYAYGIPQYLPIDEKHPVSAANPYALSKLMAEELCQFYGAHYQVPFTIVRPFNVYGAKGNKKLLIPEIIEQIERGKEIEVKDLVPKRDYIFINDLIDLLIRLMEDQQNEIYNAGSGESLSVAEVIKVCQRVWGTDLPIISNDVSRQNEIPETQADMTKVKEKLSWSPSFSFEAGIRFMKENK